MLDFSKIYLDTSDETKCEVISMYVKEKQKSGNYGTYCLQKGQHKVNVVKDDDYIMTEFSDLKPGMTVKCCRDQFEEMDTGYLIGTHRRFKIEGIVKIKEAIILVTDDGIIASNDIHVELGIKKLSKI